MSSAGRNVLGKCTNILLSETTCKSKLLLSYMRNNVNIVGSLHLSRCLYSCFNSLSQVKCRKHADQSPSYHIPKQNEEFTNQRNLWQVQKRYASEKPIKSTSENDQSSKKEIMEAKESPYAHLTLGEKVKEAGKDATYAGIVIIGIGVTGVMFYAVGRELFSSQSPGGLYGKALKLCQKNDQLKSMLGEPIKGYGETTRRGRRRYVSHQEYIENGVKYMRIRFYIEGPHAKGTVNLEAKQNDKGKYEYRYIAAELDGYPTRTVLVVDNT